MLRPEAVTMPRQAAKPRARGARLRRRMSASVLTLVLLTACGSAHKPANEPHKPSDEQLVAQTLRSYLTAQAKGDGQAACALLTPGAQQQLVALVVKQAKGLITTRPSCVDAVHLVGEVAGARFLSAVANARIERVHVSGAAASAEVADGSEFAPQHVTLTKVGSAWLIAGVPKLGS